MLRIGSPRIQRWCQGNGLQQLSRPHRDVNAPIVEMQIRNFLCPMHHELRLHKFLTFRKIHPQLKETQRVWFLLIDKR